MACGRCWDNFRGFHNASYHNGSYFIDQETNLRVLPASMYNYTLLHWGNNHRMYPRIHWIQILPFIVFSRSLDCNQTMIRFQVSWYQCSHKPQNWKYLRGLVSSFSREKYFLGNNQRNVFHICFWQNCRVLLKEIHFSFQSMIYESVN